MNAFEDNAPLRLSLPWLPPIGVDKDQWQSSVADRVEEADLFHLIGGFNCFGVEADQIHFYMHPPLRRAEFKKAIRNDRRWLAFQRSPLECC